MSAPCRRSQGLRTEHLLCAVREENNPHHHAHNHQCAIVGGLQIAFESACKSSRELLGQRVRSNRIGIGISRNREYTKANHMVDFGLKDSPKNSPDVVNGNVLAASKVEVNYVDWSCRTYSRM